MAARTESRGARRARLLTRTMIGLPCLVTLVPTQPAAAQGRVVSACSGVSLPPSVVTGIMAPVIAGIATPTEGAVNGILNLPLLRGLLPTLNLNASGLLTQAAAGSPITLKVLASDGTLIGPSDQCRLTADAITLDTPAGLAIGGNQVTGLGANGAAAFASDIDAIAFGNNARAEAGATGSLALGANSNVAAANSVALGAGSTAARGALASYTALGLTGSQASAGEVSIGAPGAQRQLTNVAAGTLATDAATVGQLTGVQGQVAALDAVAIRYDGPGRDRVTLAGAAGTTIGNVAAGTLLASSTEAVNGAQLFATNQAVGANTTAIAGLDTRVGANTTALSGLDTRVTSTASGLAALDAVAVRYDATDRLSVTFGGSGGTVLNNIAPGAVTTASLQAVNGSQLFAVSAQVAANTAAIAGLGAGVSAPVRYSSAAAPTVPNGGATSDDVTLVGAGGGAVGLHNVRDGVLAAGSTDGATAGQLFTTNQVVTGNTVAIAGLDGRVTATETQLAGLRGAVTTTDANVAVLSGQVTANIGAITGLTTALANQPLRYADAASPTVPNGGTVSDEATLAGAGGGPVGLHNVRSGIVASGSTDAVNGGQLAATNAQVAVNTGAITSLTGLLTASPVSPVQYSDPATPTVPDGGALTNDVTIVGANQTAPVVVHNVAAGAMTAGSTEAVNGQQLLAVATTAANGVQYDRDTAGGHANIVTLTGGTPGAAVTIANVAAGTVAAGSTQAVNGGELFATDQAARQAGSIAANSVQYDAGRAGVTLAGPAPVALHNVAPGTSTTDAVNVGQLQAGMQNAMAAVSDDMDVRMQALAAMVGFDIRSVRREVGAGTSAALAAAGLPQATEPGRTMIAIGGGTYRGQSAVAFGASTFLDDGHSILRLGATYDSRGRTGANAGYGYQF